MAIKASWIGIEAEGGIARARVEGTTAGGRRIEGTIAFETDGRDAWWDDGAIDGGIEPGDEEAGWDEILIAIDELPETQAACSD